MIIMDRLIEYSLVFWIFYLLFSIGLYLIARRVDYSVPFFSFIPYLQFSVVFSIAWYGKWIIILFLLLSSAAFFNQDLIYVLFAMIEFVILQMWLRSIWSLWYSLLAMIFPPLGFFIIWLKLHNKTIQEQADREHRKELRKLKKKEKKYKIIMCSSCWNELNIPLKTTIKHWTCPQCWNSIDL
jgi:hypothetical protein